MQQFLRNNKIVLAGIILGAVAGFFYWKFFGCTNGCAIKSKPLLMMLYGMMMGGLTFSLFKTKKS